MEWAAISGQNEFATAQIPLAEQVLQDKLIQSGVGRATDTTNTTELKLPHSHGAMASSGIPYYFALHRHATPKTAFCMPGKNFVPKASCHRQLVLMSHPGIHAWQVIVEQERRHFTGSNLTFPSVPSSFSASCMVQQVFAIICMWS